MSVKRPCNERKLEIWSDDMHHLHGTEHNVEVLVGMLFVDFIGERIAGGRDPSTAQFQSVLGAKQDAVGSGYRAARRFRDD